MIYQISTKKTAVSQRKTIPGFTLIELLLVLALMALVTVIITPQLGRSIPLWETKESAKNISTAIKLARYYALTRQEIVVFALDTNNGSFIVKSIRGSAGFDEKNHVSLIQRQFLGKGVKVIGLEGFQHFGTEQGLIFWPDGRTGDADIVLTADETAGVARWRILVQNDGSVALQEVFGNE